MQEEILGIYFNKARNSQTWHQKQERGESRRAGCHSGRPAGDPRSWEDAREATEGRCSQAPCLWRASVPSAQRTPTTRLEDRIRKRQRRVENAREDSPMPSCLVPPSLGTCGPKAHEMLPHARQSGRLDEQLPCRAPGTREPHTVPRDARWGCRSENRSGNTLWHWGRDHRTAQPQPRCPWACVPEKRKFAISHTNPTRTLIGPAGVPTVVLHRVRVRRTVFRAHHAHTQQYQRSPIRAATGRTARGPRRGKRVAGGHAVCLRLLWWENSQRQEWGDGQVRAIRKGVGRQAGVAFEGRRTHLWWRVSCTASAVHSRHRTHAHAHPSRASSPADRPGCVGSEPSVCAAQAA